MGLLSKICNILIGAILVFVILVAGALLLPRAFGYQIYGVLSGSMEPHFHVGSVVYVEPVAADEIQVGDPITFKMPNDVDLVATHRVVEIDSENKQFTTKGDANEVEDVEPVSFDRLIGRAVASIPYLGYLSIFMQSSTGIVVGIGLLLFMVFLSILGDLGKKKKPEETPPQNE